MKNVLPCLVCFQSGEGDITWYIGKVEGCTGGSSLFRLYKLPSAQSAENQEKRLYILPCTQFYLPIISIKNMQIFSVVSQANLLSVSFDLLIWLVRSHRARGKQMRWTPGSEATSPWQQEEKRAHPAPGDDLAHKSYNFQGAVIK